MTPLAIITMLAGLAMTWGGLIYAISVQIKATKKEANINLNK